MKWSAVIAVLGAIASVSALPTEHRRFYPRSSGSLNSTDWCAQAYNASALTQYGWFSGDLALKCLQSLPYDQQIAESTIDTVQKMFNQFFSPENYYKQSSNPALPISIDIAGTLANISEGIQNKRYSYFEYQYAITQLIRSLNDGKCFVWIELIPGHTGYQDGCTGAFAYRVPLPMVLLSSDGASAPEVYVRYLSSLIDYRLSHRRLVGMMLILYQLICKTSIILTSQYNPKLKKVT